MLDKTQLFPLKRSQWKQHNYDQQGQLKKHKMKINQRITVLARVYRPIKIQKRNQPLGIYHRLSKQPDICMILVSTLSIYCQAIEAAGVVGVSLSGEAFEVDQLRILHYHDNGLTRMDDPYLSRFIFVSYLTLFHDRITPFANLLWCLTKDGGYIPPSWD